MAFGLIIIGDEILSGKRIDKHFSTVVGLLRERGLQLAWTELLGDDPARITATLQRTMATGDIVFSCGGIGATPDDHTRQCAAAALGVELTLHPKAKAKIQERMHELALEAGKTAVLDTPDNLQRLKMGEFPQGADIIPNAYNKIPGFTVRGPGGGAHHFVPGFPVMATPMIEWVLDHHYADLFNREVRSELAVMLYETAESLVTPLMEAIEAKYPLAKVFSLPSVGDARTRRHIELGVKGDPQQVEAAFRMLLAGLDQLGAEYRQQA